MESRERRRNVVDLVNVEVIYLVLSTIVSPFQSPVKTVVNKGSFVLRSIISREYVIETTVNVGHVIFRCPLQIVWTGNFPLSLSRKTQRVRSKTYLVPHW